MNQVPMMKFNLIAKFFLKNLAYLNNLNLCWQDVFLQGSNFGYDSTKGLVLPRGC